VEQLPRIVDVASPHGTPGDTLVGPADMACGPLAPLPRPLDSFAHIWPQVELGVNTCDDDLPHFVIFLGGMLMVKMGVSDRQ
jgi:hypothetical protein